MKNSKSQSANRIVIGADTKSINAIKEYIKGYTGSVKREINEETKTYLEESLKDASEAIYKDYDSKYKELTDAIARAEANGGEGLEALRLQLDALIHNTNDKFNALDSLEIELGKLNGDYDNLYEGITTGKIFSAGQLDEIINTAMIDHTTITDDGIWTPNTFTTKIVALIGNFGSVKAANIAAGTIAGSSIESTNIISAAPNPNKVAEGEPVWKIDNAGNGWLAKGNIYWDRNGNVTFGPDVKITWESIEDGNSVVNNVLKGYDEDIRKYVESYVSDNTAGAASRAELEQARKDAEDAVGDLKILLQGEITENIGQVNEAIGAIETWKETEYNTDQQNLRIYADGVAKALEEAYLTGDEGLIAKLEALKKEVEWEMGKLQEEYQMQAATIGSLKGEMDMLSQSALTKYNMQELLAASMVNKTEITDQQISTPSLLAQKIVALVATFGLVKASKIVGTNIQGYTVSSPTEIKDDDGNIVYEDAYEIAIDQAGNPIQATDENGNKLWEDFDCTIPKWQYATEFDPLALNTDGSYGRWVPKKIPAELDRDEIAWLLDSDGSGWVAEKQILWDYPRKENGEIDYPADKITDEQRRHWRRGHVKVELGDGVQIKWVTNALNKIGSKLADWAADGKMSPIEQKELFDLYNEYTEEYNRLCAQYNNYVTLTCPFPGNLKSDFDGAYNNLTSAVKHHTRGIYNWSTNTPLVEDAVIEDYSKYDDKLKTIDIDKDDAGNAIAANKKLENVKKFVTARETFADGVAKAYSDWRSERTTKENLHKWAKDGVLSPLEQKNLYNTYLADKKEYEDLVATCETIETNASERADKTVQISYKSEFDSAWSKYVSALKHHTSGVYTWSGNTATKIESEDIINPINIEYNDANKKWSNITNYYGIKSKFITEINAELSDAISIEAGINLKHSLQDWAADGKLSPIEQKELIIVFDEIVEEYAKIISDITSYNDMGAGITDAEKNAYKGATDNAKAAIKHHTRGVYNWSGDKHSAKVSLTGVDTDSITVNENASASQKYENINEYYVARQVLTNIINKKLAKASINTADANRKKAMNDWAADGKLSPIEQKELKKTYEGFIKEKNQISTDIQNLKNAGGTLKNANGTVDNSSETNFNTAYAAMVEAVKYHTSGVYNWSSDTSASDKGTDNYTTVGILTSGDSAYSNINTYLEKKQQVISALANGTARLAGAAAETAAAANIQTAEKTIAGNLAAAEARLNKAITDGDDNAVAQAEGARELAQDAKDALETLESALYGNWDDDPGDGSVLNSGDLYNLSLAACGAAAAKALDSGSIAADNVFAQNIVGLAGTFAKITAEQITSTEITGKTISSTDNASGKDYKKWQLNADGSGWVANKQIEWNADGSTVTLGNNVNIAWKNVTGSDTVDKSISDAQTTANTASTAASNAKTTADEAKTTADEAKTAAAGKVDATYVGSAINTSLSNFEIQSHRIKGNLIEGKTIESSTDVTLEQGTKYYTHGNPDSNGNYTYTANTAGTNSSGPAWQIRENGEGYLAGGAIRFNKDGITGVNGDQLMDGGLGSSSKLSDLIADKATIGNLDVTQLNTTGWDSEGKPKEGAGTITIQDDFINVYGKDGNYPVRNVIKISGNDINDRPKDRTETIPGETLDATSATTSFNFDLTEFPSTQITSFLTGQVAQMAYFYPYTYSAPISTKSGYNAKTFTVAEGKAGVMANSSAIGSITISLKNDNTAGISTGIAFAANGYLYITDKDDTALPSSTLAYGPFFDAGTAHKTELLYVYNQYTPDTITVSNLKIIYKDGILDGNGGIKAGNYKIVPIIRMSFGRFEPNGDKTTTDNVIDTYLEKISIDSISVTYPKLTFSTPDTHIDRGPQSRCDISPLGFRYWADKTKYVEFLKNGSFILRNGNNILAVDDKGIGINLNGDTANLQKIITKEFKFRLRNYDGKNYAAVKIPVLCLDGTFTAEDDN